MAARKNKIINSTRAPIRRAPIDVAPDARFSLLTEEDLTHSLQALQELDTVCITKMLETAGHPPLRARRADLSGLVWIIVSQQVSTASARAIFARFENKYGDVNHRQLLAATDEELRSCGLSRPKIRTLRNIAAAIEAKNLDLDRLKTLDAQAAREQMTAINGIGPWTADIYLLFCLGHPDVWPAGDLALQEGVRIALGLRTRPDVKKLEKLSQRWRPHRAAAARLIWAFYGKTLENRRQSQLQVM